MVTVHVKLFATLRHRFPELGIGEMMTVELPDEATVGQMVEQLDLPRDLVKIVFVNHTIRQESHRLVTGDTVAIFPPSVTYSN